MRDEGSVGYKLACETLAKEGSEIILEEISTVKIAGVADQGHFTHNASATYGIAIDVGSTTMVFHLVDLLTADIVASVGKVNPQVVFGSFTHNASATYGIAIDVGSTTMVFHLVDLLTADIVASVGKVNPQVVFGSDVIARINASSKPGGLDDLCDCLLSGMRDACEELCRHTGIKAEDVKACSVVGNTTMQHFICGLDPHDIGIVSGMRDACEELCRHTGIKAEDVKACSVVGNTTMQHFICGLDPHDIGIAPFTPQSLFGGTFTLHQPLLPSLTQAYLAPAVAGYVGGDITAGIRAARMRDHEALQLFIDIGTNGEMALGNDDKIVCCATAAGPAFEGASITLGMPAMPGAISKVTLGDGEFQIETVDDAPAIGICGSGLLDAVAAVVSVGLVDETGYLCDEDEADEHWSHCIGEENGETVCYLDAAHNVYLAQSDVRKVQLAKSAIRAGIETMMAEFDATYENGETVCYLDAAHNVYLAQSDVRKVQLAKSAIRAGIETMMAEFDATYDQIDEVALAGGFGMHLDPHSATAIGLIPPALDGKVRACGNTAGQGAVECLFEQGRAGGFGMHLDPHSATAIGLIPPALDGKVRACGNTAGQGAVECLFEQGREATEEMHLDPHSATAIGLIPPALDGKVRACGNTAGQGAVECLFEQGREATEEIAELADYLELSTDKRFNEFYIDFMGFEEE